MDWHKLDRGKGTGAWVHGATVALLACYLASSATVGQFPFIDEVAYKCAGFHWADSGHYAAPELTGLLSIDPPVEVIWAGYPPLYTFTFGLLVKLFGFGWRTCVLFDASIRVVLAWLTYRLARLLGPSLGPGAAWLAGLAVIPLGHAGRPDELAMCFGLAGMLFLLQTPLTWVRLALAGLLLGLSAATSPATGVVFGIVQAVLLFGADGQWLRNLGRLAVLGLLAGATLLLICLPLLLAHPGALRQFLAHAGRVPSPDFLGGLLAGFRFCWAVARCRLLAILGLAVLGAVAVSRHGLPCARVWLGAWAGLLFLVLFSSYRFTYFWFVGPIFLAAAVATMHSLWTVGRWRFRAFALVLGLAVLVGALPWLRSTCILYANPAGQALDRNFAEVASQIPPASVVVTDLYWWALADGRTVYDLNFGQPPSLDQVDYIVLSGNGSRTPGQPCSIPPDLQAYVRKHFHVVYDNLNRQPLRWFGVRLSASAYGFGPLILARENLEAHAGPAAFGGPPAPDSTNPSRP